jgi:uncharacterized membrane protein (DUF4010 family)
MSQRAKIWISFFILTILIGITIFTLLFAPQYIQAFATLAIALLGVFAIWTHVRRRWNKYQQGEATRGQTFLRLLLDLIGLALGFTLAILLGKLAEGWASTYGLWTGILVGCAICFLVALSIAKLWNRVNNR